jgi:hypothetical protein
MDKKAGLVGGLKDDWAYGRMNEWKSGVFVYTLQIKRYNSMILHLACVYNIFMWILLIFSGLAKGLQNFRKGKICIVDWFAGRKSKDHSWHNYSLNFKKYIYEDFLL